MVRAKNVELAYIKEQSGDIVIGQSADYFGSSTDAKPTDKVVGGSTFIETDTGNFYYFDENSSTWVKKNESGGGGGGSSDFSTAEVTITTNVDVDWNAVVISDQDEINTTATTQVGTNTILVVLYKEYNYIYTDLSDYGLNVNVSVTGDIEHDGEGQFDITGNGTINLVFSD